MSDKQIADCKEASEMLNQEISNDKEFEDMSLVQKGKFIKKGEATIVGEDGDLTVGWNVKPKVKIGKLLKGDVAGAVQNTSVSLLFNKEFKNSDVEIEVRVNGNAAMLMKSPAGKADASVSFTKKF